mmetsp:Transcript_9577/g.19258  ORF Transcript_9577/g.19258 Transcript_9577/m.19258 type:complete len:200 (-) Transcript_9577:3324-3923(-)
MCMKFVISYFSSLSMDPAVRSLSSSISKVSISKTSISATETILLSPFSSAAPARSSSLSSPAIFIRISSDQLLSVLSSAPIFMSISSNSSLAATCSYDSSEVLGLMSSLSSSSSKKSAFGGAFMIASVSFLSSSACSINFSVSSTNSSNVIGAVSSSSSISSSYSSSASIILRRYSLPSSDISSHHSTPNPSNEEVPAG